MEKRVWERGGDKSSLVSQMGRGVIKIIRSLFKCAALNSSSPPLFRQSRNSIVGLKAPHYLRLTFCMIMTFSLATRNDNYDIISNV